MQTKSKLLMASAVAILLVLVLPGLAQAETVTTNGVITTVAGPEVVARGKPFAISITFETPGDTTLYAYQYPTLAASTNLYLANVTYTSTGTSPQHPENNYTISDTAVFDESGVTNLHSPWAHWGYCPAMGFGDKITWDYASFVTFRPGDYTFTVAVGGLFWSATDGALWIDPADPVLATHTVTVSFRKGRHDSRSHSHQ